MLVITEQQGVPLCHVLANTENVHDAILFAEYMRKSPKFSHKCLQNMLAKYSHCGKWVQYILK